MLVDKRKVALVLTIVEYLQLLESQNPIVRAELALVLGKLFKTEKNFDKALLAFEECLYLGYSVDDNRLKIKSIVLISSCYLEMGDLHRSILYYQKLLDIENSLLESYPNTVQTYAGSNDDEVIINLELRIAIRQNLHMAHLR